MNETKHTPLPWAVYHEQHGVKYIGDANRVLAVLTQSSERQGADTEMVIRAVNNHAALVEALEELLDAYTAERALLKTCDVSIEAAQEAVRIKRAARAALAAARE